MNIDTILLDLDGTLWNPVDSVIRSWQAVISKYTEYVDEVSDEEIVQCMGLNNKEIEEKLLPKASEQKRKEIMEECMAFEHEQLRKEGNMLYPGVEETLAQLAKDYKLAIVSNCEAGYIEIFLNITKLDKYIDYHICYGDTMQVKGENIITALKKLNSKNAIYVGDTGIDAQAAKHAGIPFVYVKYGYSFGGMPQKMRDYAIDEFSELLDLVKY